jgi:hypothetical protein
MSSSNRGTTKELDGPRRILVSYVTFERSVPQSESLLRTQVQASVSETLAHEVARHGIPLSEGRTEHADPGAVRQMADAIIMAETPTDVIRSAVNYQSPVRPGRTGMEAFRQDVGSEIDLERAIGIERKAYENGLGTAPQTWGPFQPVYPYDEKILNAIRRLPPPPVAR